MSFNDLYWHDAVIQKLEIDRQSPGHNDNISIEITWPNGITNKAVFEGVYWSRMIMNFGVIASESIRTANILEKNDPDLIAFYSKWKGIMGDLELNCYFINTNSTNSEIKIIAKDFRIID